MRKLVTGAVLALALAPGAALGAGALLASPANGMAPPTPWDGSNPFNCVVQDAGFGPTGPDPGADPYCVHFDKTQQNISQLGIVDFLLKEPARTAAAVPKCFYFQEDHWRSSVIQSNGKTVIYEFQGHYFFNKATGDGGAWVTGFSVGGQTFDPTQLPGFPPGYGQYFGPGTGGIISHDDVPTDPKCVDLAKQHPSAVYAPQNPSPRCVSGSGGINHRGVGPVALDATEATVRAELGPPGSVRRGFLHFCVTGGGALLVGEPGDRSGTLGGSATRRAVMVLTSGRGFVVRGGRGQAITVGAARRRVLRAFRRARLLARLGPVRVLRVERNLLVGVRRGRVVFLGSYDRRRLRARRGVVGYLRRSR